jgi:hypothetical protein
MSAESKKSRDTLADQLAAFDDRLQTMAGDVDMLADIQEGIGALLSSGENSEAEIRGVLQERFEAGELRKETFQLVKSMLDRYVTEKLPTSPTATVVIPSPFPDQPSPQHDEPPPGQDHEDSFRTTTVLPNDVAPVNDAEARVQVGSILRDRFLLQQKVSGGSMGVVYKALDRRLAEAGSEQPSVAIKILSPALARDGQALRALQQEATKTRCLVHPNIVRFIDLDRDDDLYFLILEWLEGRTLADILDSSDARSIDREAAFRIVRQVGDALSYAHRCGIVHADVKPGNIMILPDGSAKLFDFGVARVRQKQADTDFDPGVLGALTPAYSSLQVLGGEDPVAADDVFSLGCLLYRLVAGYRVFGPRNAAEASEAGMQPQRPQGLTDGQWHALKKALSYARVTRYSAVQAFLDELGEQQEPAISIEPPERFATDDGGGSPGKWIAIIVVLLGLAGIGAKQLGYLDPWLAKFGGTESMVEIAPPETIVEEVVEDPIREAAPVNESAPEPVPKPVPEAAPAVVEPVTGEMAAEVAADDLAPSGETAAEAPASAPRAMDFSQLPPADAIVRVARSGDAREPIPIVLREDGDPVVVDFIRDGNPERPMVLRLEEIGFSGATSPWNTGQYALSNAGLVAFSAGQQRARMTFRTASDPRREADQQSTLRLRLNEDAEAEFARLRVTIEDDDQRAFEERLPINTLGFATSQISVDEADTAVQINVTRYNPDSSSMVVAFTVEDLTATEGEDYFAPANFTVSFPPGQGTARLLIPLVQDSRAEGDEAFVVKLNVDKEAQPQDVSPNLAVMIRDDEM